MGCFFIGHASWLKGFKLLRENTDFYPSMAIGIRTQIGPSATCRSFTAEGLMFLCR